MLRSPAVSSKIPYSLKDIFKFIVDTGHKAWFSATLKTWILTGDSAMDSLRKASEKILIRDLTDYHIEWTTSEQDAGFRSNTRWEFTGQTFPGRPPQKHLLFDLHLPEDGRLQGQ